MNYKEIVNNLKFWIKEEPSLLDSIVDYSKETNNPQILLELSQALISLNHYAKALECLKLVYDSEKDNNEWYFLMGEVYYYLCIDHEDNIEDLREALSYLLKAEKLGNKKARNFIDSNLSKLTEKELDIKTIPELPNN